MKKQILPYLLTGPQFSLQLRPVCTTGPQRKRSRAVFYTTVLLVILATFVLLIFWPAIRFDFVNFDDNIYVTQNPHVLSGLNLENIRWAFLTHLGGHWHPLTWISLQLDISLFGPDPTMFHFENIIVHTLSACLLALFLSRISNNVYLSCLLAALFAVHPLRLESVVWVTERKDVYSVFFGILTLFFYEHHSQKKNYFYFLSLLSFAIALLFKPSVVVLPVLLLFLDDFIFAHGKKTGTLPFFLLSLISSVITLYSQNKEGALKGLQTLSLLDRVTISSYAYLNYLGKTFFPDKLSVFYPLVRYPFYWGVISVGVLIFITTAFILARKKYPALIFTWLWFLVSLFPVCGLLQVGGQFIADRWTYWPHMGIAIGSAYAYRDWRGEQRYQKISYSILLIILMALVYKTRIEIIFWENSEKLFTHSLENTQNNFLAHTNLGEALSRKGDLNQAQTHYEQALMIHPRYVEALNNLGNIYGRKGDFSQAISLFLRTLSIDPQDFKAQYNLGLAYYQSGQKTKALTTWLDLTHSFPEYQPTWDSLIFMAKNDFPSLCESRSKNADDPSWNVLKNSLQTLSTASMPSGLEERLSFLKNCFGESSI